VGEGKKGGGVGVVMTRKGGGRRESKGSWGYRKRGQGAGKEGERGEGVGSRVGVQPCTC